jgi:hypothetical protein
MIYGNHRMAIPSNYEYSVPQLRTLMQELERILEREIASADWNRL